MVVRLSLRRLTGSVRQRRVPMASHSRYFREGVIAGLIGAALVAVWFLIYDAARGRPFRTPALLGAATFEGVTNPVHGSHRGAPGAAVHRAARRGVRHDRGADRLPDRLGPARAEPGDDAVHRAHVLRDRVPRGGDLARAPGARRAGVVGHPRRQRARRGRDAALPADRPARGRPRAAGPALDPHGARGHLGRPAGRRRGRDLVPGLRRGGGHAPAHPRAAGGRALPRAAGPGRRRRHRPAGPAVHDRPRRSRSWPSGS